MNSYVPFVCGPLGKSILNRLFTDPTVTVTSATATAVTTITDTATILTAAATGDFTLD